MKTIIVVEGKSDTNRLKLIFPDIITFETSGLGLDDTKIKQLKELSKNHKLIVFTDPDGPGEIIRQRIIDNIEGVFHAYLPNEKALSKRLDQIGVEHAAFDDIKKSLKNLYEISSEKGNYEIGDLIDLGIYNDKKKRKQFCDILNIAYGNNQKILKQMNNFNIAPQIIIDAINIVK